MKAIQGLLVSVAVLLAPMAVSAAPTRYVVVFTGDGVPKAAAEAIVRAGGTLEKAFPQVGIGIASSADPEFVASLRGKAGVHAVDAARFFEAPRAVAVGEPDATSPTAVDAYYGAYQWGIRWVNANLAWSITSGSHATTVAVIDTGVAWNHPDLAPNVTFTACYSVYLKPCSPYPNGAFPDDAWHGTHVAGTIAAAFGGGRVVGVGPNLSLAAYNVFEPTSSGDLLAWDESIWAAMIDAAERGFSVINMSLGGYVVFPQKDAATWTAWNRVADFVRRKGVTIVASSGNGDVNLNGPLAHVPSDLSGVVSVGATGIRPAAAFPQPGTFDVRAAYSNFGAAVDVVAPGGDTGPDGTPWPFPGAYYLVLSTSVALNPGCAATASCPPAYSFAGGTSMASPHVAGAAGLVKDRFPGLNPEQVAAVLTRTSENLGDRQSFGHGMIDAYKALGGR